MSAGINFSLRRRAANVLMDAATFPPVARERQIKRWTHEIKAALVAGDSKKVKSLAKRRVL
ncbi:MAG TPA: hypothetical protein VFE47_07820 [Tepidisphaeraceae bacterium]|nr:hypothetical protein [Tepidisphaeraceae bacterium]